MLALRSVRAAFVFLSRIPVGGFPYDATEWRWAPAHFPAVGLVIGSLGGATLLATSSSLGSRLAAVFALLVTIAATGAFHEDGLADSADALGGAHGTKKILEILKDSRIGTYGASALLFSVLLRCECLAQLPAAEGAIALVLAHCLARVGPVWLLGTLPYVSDGPIAKGSSVAAARSPQACVATGWGVLCAAGAASLGGGFHMLAPACVLALVLLVPLLGRYFVKRAGGITGDFLGAAEQLGECVVLALSVALLKN